MLYKLEATRHDMNLISMSNMMFSICSFLVIFSLISNVHGSVVKNTTCSESTALNSTLIQAVLDAHNLHRCQAGDAADMIKLVWSDRVASIAQDHANLCTTSLVHSQCDSNGGMAKNTYTLINWPAVSTADVSMMVRSWASGSQYYDSTTGNYTDVNYRGMGLQYKQLMWASSSEIGCGMSERDFGGALFGPDRKFVCYYNPGGNVVGSQKPYWQGTPCSKYNQHSGLLRLKRDLTRLFARGSANRNAVLDQRMYPLVLLLITFIKHF